MPPRRVSKKIVSPELKSESSLSSALSIEEDDEPLHLPSPPVPNTSVQARKRRAEVASVAVTTGKRIKTTKSEIVDEDAPEQTIATPSKTRKSRVVKKSKSEVNGNILKETTSIKASKAEPTKSVKSSRVTKSTTLEGSATDISPKKARGAKKGALVDDTVEDDEAEEEVPKKPKRHRKTKEEKEAEAMPLAARTNGLRMFIGAHVSCAKGVHNAVTNGVHIGGNAFALFLKSQRKWENPPLQDEHRDQFKVLCNDQKYDAAKHILPHGSYLVNLAQEDPTKARQAYDAFIDDLHRCEALGIKLYNFHPGNTGPAPRSAAISRIATALNHAHTATKTVKPVLENMAGGSNVIGSTFEDLRDIIAQVNDKSRIGVCIDTCHSFAAGYDLRTPDAFKRTLDDFDTIVGMKYLSALHLNDSKAPFNSHRDLHQNIGLGFLGLRAFHSVMNEPRFEGLPLVLETPIDRKNEEGKDVEDKGVWAKEIKLLESLIGMDAEGDVFRGLEKELADLGVKEREKFQDQFERKLEKEKKAAEKGNGKGKGKRKRKKKGESESEGEGEGSDT